MAATMGISAFMTVLKGATTVMATYNMAQQLGAVLTEARTGKEVALWLVEKLSLKDEEAGLVIKELSNLKDQKAIALKAK